MNISSLEKSKASKPSREQKIEIIGFCHERSSISFGVIVPLVKPTLVGKTGEGRESERAKTLLERARLFATELHGHSVRLRG